MQSMLIKGDLSHMINGVLRSCSCVVGFIGLLGKTDRMLGGHLGLFPQLSIGHERLCKIFYLNYFKTVIKPEDSTSQTQFAQ